MKEFVTDIKQLDHGVEIKLGTGVEKQKMDAMAAKCGPGGTGCNSDCCDTDFQALIEGIDVSGVDDSVTMHLRGAVSASKVANIMSRCDCYNEV
jgi:hypothetical protein